MITEADIKWLRVLAEVGISPVRMLDLAMRLERVMRELEKPREA